MLQDDIVFNENRHLLYNLLDNYYEIGDKFWDNHFHTMLVSCTFSLMYAEGYRREIFKESDTINTILDFFQIPHLSMEVMCKDGSDYFFYKVFYYKYKFFASFEDSDKKRVSLIRKEVIDYTYRNVLYGGKEYFTFFEVHVPTNYTGKEFLSFYDKYRFKGLRHWFLEYYGYPGGMFGKICEYSKNGVDSIYYFDTEIPTDDYVCIYSSVSEFRKKRR